MFLAKNEDNLAQSTQNEIAIQTKYYDDAIAKAEEYKAQFALVNPHATEEQKEEVNERVLSLQREYYKKLLDLSADYYEEVADLKEDKADLEEDLVKEEKLHKKSVNKQFKAEVDFKNKKIKLWETYNDKREDLEKKLADIGQDYRDDKLQSERDLRDTIEGLDDDLEDKIRRKRQSGMSDVQKAKDDEQAFYKKIAEADKLIREGQETDDEGLIERGREKASQAMGLAEANENVNKSISGMIAANKRLQTSEEALAEIQAEKAKEDFVGDKKDAELSLAELLVKAKEDAQDLQNQFNDNQNKRKEALADELGVRADMYKTVAEFEDARHTKAIDNIAIEKTKIEELIGVYVKLAAGTEVKAKEVAPTTEKDTTKSDVKDLGTEYSKTAEGIKKDNEEIIKHGYAVIEKNGKMIATNISEAFTQSHKNAAKGFEEFIVIVTEGGKRVITTANSMATGFSTFGKVLKTESIVAVNQLGTEIENVSKNPLEIKVDDTMGRVRDYIATLKVELNSIGDAAGTGLKIIGPEQMEQIEAVKDKISSLFDGLSTTDPKQKLQDMITVLSDLGPVNEEVFNGMKQEIIEYVATLGDVDVKLVSGFRNGMAVLRDTSVVLDETGKKVEGLNKKIQSNPFELYSSEFAAPIINGIQSIEGAYAHLEGRVTEETKIKISTEEANSKITETVGNFHDAKEVMEGGPIVIDVLSQKITETVGTFHDAKEEMEGAPIVVEVDTSAKKMTEVIDDFHELKENIKGQELPIEVQLKGTEEVEDFQEWVDESSFQQVDVNINTIGGEQVQTVHQLVTELVGKVVEIVADVSGIDEVNELYEAVERLHDKTITITTNYATSGQQLNTGGLVQMFANGGDVFRKLASPLIRMGSGLKDDVPAMLTKGEFVHNVGAVSKYGVDFMRAINNLSFPVPAKFATGGPVGISSGALSSIGDTVHLSLDLPTSGPPIDMQLDSMQLDELLAQLNEKSRMAS